MYPSLTLAVALITIVLSERQYKIRLKQWKLEKKVPGHKMGHMRHKKERVKAERKESIFPLPRTPCRRGQA